MIITFTQNKKKGAITVSGACEAKYYAVPADYSDDGYYAAVWLSQDLEPVPACAVESTELLAHVRVLAGDDGEYTLQEVFCKEGVKYAAS
ncbi:MAG: hypothetical protein DELT_02670 [Desulfovibrio sp.]